MGTAGERKTRSGFSCEIELTSATIFVSFSLASLTIPSFVHGTGLGLIDATIFPIMAVLVDTRHRAVYGSVYAITDLAFCTPYVIGWYF